MVPRTALINFLRRAHRFSFKRETERIEIYKQKGSVLRVEVQKCDMLEDATVRTILNHAGVSKADVERFIVEAKN